MVLAFGARLPLEHIIPQCEALIRRSDVFSTVATPRSTGRSSLFSHFVLMTTRFADT